ncbi:unnamed protein product [Clonostachys rhizophaga]|uniref:Uncharacterized protein n=1 Tax=Clonostachys rhizophaga TaxID=160324 RepID=A0A9N9V546_9HYPO|nr:unnamed protein product [Clonostachys rhizophaga]
MVFVLGDLTVEGHSFHGSDVAKIQYLTIEGRNAGFCWTAVIRQSDGTTMVFVSGNVAVEGHSFYESDIAKMKYITIEGRNPGFCWVPDTFNLQPGPASGALGILASLAKDLKAIFMHSKLSISASEDPEFLAQDLEMFQIPEFVESSSTPSLPQGGNPRGRHGPYRTPLQYFVSTAERHLELIVNGQLYPEYAKEAFAFYSLLRDKAAPVLTKRSGDDRKFWIAQRLSMWQGNPRGRHRQVSQESESFSHLPADLIESFVQNEYATLKWLSKTGIPVLEAHGYGLASDPSNHVGVSYMFLCVMPGKPRNTSYRSQGCVRAQQVDVPGRTHRSKFASAFKKLTRRFKTTSASEDPVRIAQNLDIYMTPNPFAERARNLQPRSASGALSILATLARDIKAVFVQHKLSISASEDPVRIAQYPDIYVAPDPFVEGSSSAAKVEGQGTKSASIEFESANSAATSQGVRGFSPVANAFLFDTAKIEEVILVCNGGRRLNSSRRRTTTWILAPPPATNPARPPPPHLSTKAAVQTPTIFAPERVTEEGLVRWDKQAVWSFQGMDPHTISQVCKDSRDIVQKQALYCSPGEGRYPHHDQGAGRVREHQHHDVSPITTKKQIVCALMLAMRRDCQRLSSPRDRDRLTGSTLGELTDGKNDPVPVAEATINPLPKLGIHRPVRKDLGKKLASFHLFNQLPQELQDEIWSAMRLPMTREEMEDYEAAMLAAWPEEWM